MPEVSLGFLTDLHNSDRANQQFDIWLAGAWRVYSTALTRLQAALDYWESEGLKLAVLTGDIIDGQSDSKTFVELIREVMVVINASDFVTNGGRVIIIPGNHEEINFGNGKTFGWSNWWAELDTGDGHVTIENSLTPAAEDGPTAYTYDFGGFRLIATPESPSDEFAAWYNDRINADNTPVIALNHTNADFLINDAPTVRNMQLILRGHNHTGEVYATSDDVGIFKGWGSIMATHGTPWTSADNAYYKITVKSDVVGGETYHLPNVEIIGQELGAVHNKSFDTYFVG